MIPAISGRIAWQSAIFSKAAEHRVVVESSSLLRQCVFQVLTRSGNLDHFVESILNYGIGETCGDIRNLRPFFLSLLTLEFINTVHRVPRSMGCLANSAAFANPARCSSEIWQKFYKGTAAGGARFVKLYAVNRLVLYLDATSYPGRRYPGYSQPPDQKRRPHNNEKRFPLRHRPEKRAFTNASP